MALACRQLPHAPEHPVATLSPVERRAINLTWTRPFDGNSPLMRYMLEMSENSKAGEGGKMRIPTPISELALLWEPPHLTSVS